LGSFLGVCATIVVMFSSDNGTTFDAGGIKAEYFKLTGGLRGRKQDLYEGGIRVPFIARWPGKIPGGKTSDLVFAQYDLLPTLAELTYAKAWPNDGISFLPALIGNNKQQKKHEFLYFEFPEKGGQVAIRMGNWKGVKSNMKSNLEATWEIYNLATDKYEAVNVAYKHPDLIKKFEEILKKEHQQAHIKEWEFIAPKFQDKD